jgi:hypothetical protein
MLNEFCWILISETPTGEYEAKEDDVMFNPLTPNDPSMGRTAPLTSRRCILYI